MLAYDVIELFLTSIRWLHFVATSVQMSREICETGTQRSTSLSA